MADARRTEGSFDAVVVGAGFAGMYMLHRLRGLGLRARVFEAGDDVGGTWYWNRYPGARCDVESLEYSYGFSEELQQEWVWTERYSGQPEILRYAQHVADRFDLRRDIQFGTRISAAHWDERVGRWQIRSERGDSVTAQFLIMATGCLSNANLPRFEGLDSFAGEVHHTGRWPHAGVDFRGKRVGVIGTGSSAIQAIPLIAEQAAQLTVFQRTPNYSIPARNHPLDPAEQAAVKADYAGLRRRNLRMPAALGSRRTWNQGSVLAASVEERQGAFESTWEAGGFLFLAAYGDTATDPRANAIAADFVRAKIRAIVRDPAVAELLSPSQVLGCKRLCLDTSYFETYNRPNVRLVDVNREPIESITPRGLRAGGREYELDCLIFATGFDAMTGALLAIDVRGRGGRPLREAWSEGPVTYLGLGVPGFPNLFSITGPGSPSVLANMIPAIEQHVDWIADCLAYLRARGLGRIEAGAAAARDWVAHVNAVADTTLYPTCNSWYLGANIPGKKRVFMPLPGFPAYVDKCNEVAAKGYEGFELSA
jgi:cyclohexanone monooxygenase